jgi:NADPH:quinone reductase-like Zn-dependent oxidoreductase
VYGDVGDYGLGGFAEYIAAPKKALALKPSNLTFEEAAAAPQSSVVALQALRDVGKVQPGQQVLINGASGGIGTFAVQIAKSLGAEVTGVCSARNLDLVRSLGADQVMDYSREDFTRKGRRYDVILDIVANRSVWDYARALEAGGVYASCPFSPGAMMLGPLILRTQSKRVVQFSHVPRAEDLVAMTDLFEAGKVRPVIDSRYPLSEAAEAVRHYGGGHPQGKVVITMEH